MARERQQSGCGCDTFASGTNINVDHRLTEAVRRSPRHPEGNLESLIIITPAHGTEQVSLVPRGTCGPDVLLRFVGLALFVLHAHCGKRRVKTTSGTATAPAAVLFHLCRSANHSGCWRRYHPSHPQVMTIKTSPVVETTAVSPFEMMLTDWWLTARHTCNESVRRGAA